MLAEMKLCRCKGQGAGASRFVAYWDFPLISDTLLASTYPCNATIGIRRRYERFDEEDVADRLLINRLKAVETTCLCGCFEHQIFLSL